MARTNSPKPRSASGRPHADAAEVRTKVLHLLGHAALLVLAVVAMLTMTQACSGGSTGDSGFDGSYGGLELNR